MRLTKEKPARKTLQQALKEGGAWIGRPSFDEWDPCGARECPAPIIPDAAGLRSGVRKAEPGSVFSVDLMAGWTQP